MKYIFFHGEFASDSLNYRSAHGYALVTLTVPTAPNTWHPPNLRKIHIVRVWRNHLSTATNISDSFTTNINWGSKKTKSNINHPVGGFSPTHLKNMRKSKWEASSPNIRGENSPRKIFELPPPPIVSIFRRRPATSSLRKGTSKSRCVILKVTFVPAAFVASICMALVLPTRRSTAVMMGMENTATWTDSTVRP